MATSITIASRDTLSVLRSALSKTKDEGQRHRIRAIIRIKEGIPRTQVAAQSAVSRTSVCTWVRKYNEGGIAALKTNKGGRPEGNPKWDKGIFEDLIKEIDKGGRYWSIPLMCAWIKDHKKTKIPENTVWYHVTDLKYSYKSARPHPYKGDTEKQQAFKKGALLHSWSS